MKISAIIAIVFFVFTSSFIPERKKKFTPEELKLKKMELGRQLFFDKEMSNPDGQSCTVCHAPKTAFTDPDHKAVSEGMLEGFFVNRNSQTLGYVSYAQPLRYIAEEDVWKGGLFWDGRSNSLEHQLSGPFFNKAEMNNTDTTMLVKELKEATYYKLYKSIYGRITDVNETYNHIIECISILESSDFINEFSSKYDYYLQNKLALNEEEKWGLDLFTQYCSTCHSMKEQQGKVLFTDFSYYNLGVPRNEENPFYTTDSLVNPLGRNAIDLGLGAVLKDPKQNGKFKTPTLRNIQYTGPYFHNGYARDLKEAVHFVNAHHSMNNLISEVKENIETKLTGNSRLSDQQENAIISFLLTLSDGYEFNQ